MLTSKFERFLKFLKNKNLLITTHNLADIDGFVSVITLKYILAEIFKDQKLFTYFSKLSKSTKEFIKNFSERFPGFNFTFEKEINFSVIDVIVIVDTNNLKEVELPDSFYKLDKEIPHIFIDHHFNSDIDKKIEDASLILDNFSSTAEVCFELTKSFGIRLSLPYKYLILTGIIADSGIFRHGNNGTIIRASELLDNNINYQEIIQLTQKEEDISERIAKIKGLQRVELIREGKWLIGISHVGSYEARVAVNLINIGFDVSIVYSEEKSEYRVSARASDRVCNITNLHLGKIFDEMSKEYVGSGGGHQGAAALNGIKNLNLAIELILKKIKNVLNDDI